ncbi:hypothetical protein ACA910_011904 [Epithemia clementina (nom. ined.)]
MLLGDLIANSLLRHSLRGVKFEHDREGEREVSSCNQVGVASPQQRRKKPTCSNCVDSTKHRGVVHIYQAHCFVPSDSPMTSVSDHSSLSRIRNRNVQCTPPPPPTTTYSSNSNALWQQPSAQDSIENLPELPHQELQHLEDKRSDLIHPAASDRSSGDVTPNYKFVLEKQRSYGLAANVHHRPHSSESSLTATSTSTTPLPMTSLSSPPCSPSKASSERNTNQSSQWKSSSSESPENGNDSPRTCDNSKLPKDPDTTTTSTLKSLMRRCRSERRCRPMNASLTSCSSESSF